MFVCKTAKGMNNVNNTGKYNVNITNHPFKRLAGISFLDNYKWYLLFYWCSPMQQKNSITRITNHSFTKCVLGLKDNSKINEWWKMKLTNDNTVYTVVVITTIKKLKFILKWVVNF